MADERIYLDLRDSMAYTSELEKLRRDDSNLICKTELKNVLATRMRMGIWGYSQGEYLHLLSDKGLAMKFKTYSICSYSNRNGRNKLKEKGDCCIFGGTDSYIIKK